MNTKIVLTASSVALGISGIALTFASGEIMAYLNIQDPGAFIYMLQIIGALYFGFAMLNWMTKTSLIGGIYNRPIAVANFTHFLIAGLALSKGYFTHPDLSFGIAIAGIAYVIFALLFGLILFTHPIRAEKS